MARTRMLKPEFFGDVTLGDVSRDSRLLYAGLWQLMDRRGLMEYHPKLLRRDLFPYDDDVCAALIERWVWELVRANRLHVRTYQGKRYLHCPSLPRHQHFHHNEKPNKLIPDEVLSVEPDTPPTLVPVLPRANPTASDPDTASDTASDTDAVPVLRAHGIRTAAPGFLSDVSDDVIRVWVRAYTERLVIAELPKCEAKWVSHPKRNQQGEKMLFINSWFLKAAADAKNAPLAGPRGAIDTEALIKSQRGA